MDLLRKIAAVYAVVLGVVALLNQVPGLADEQGRIMGVFALDIYDDALHLFSGLWAAIAAWLSRDAARTFLKLFGTLYFLDGLMGLVLGSGYLDLGILTQGVQSLPLDFKIKANLPHLVLGGLAMFAGFVLGKRS